jgi:hypothetical protein
VAETRGAASSTCSVVLPSSSFAVIFTACG